MGHNQEIVIVLGAKKGYSFESGEIESSLSLDYDRPLYFSNQWLLHMNSLASQKIIISVSDESGT